MRKCQETKIHSVGVHPPNLLKGPIAALTDEHVQFYRDERIAEREAADKKQPAAATLDREIALLKRMLSYAVETGLRQENPLAGAALLNEPNVRDFVLGESEFTKLYDAAEPHLKPILTSFASRITGMSS